VMKITVFLFFELIVCQNGENVNMRKLVILSLLDGARYYARGVVNQSVDKKPVVILLDFNENRFARLRGAINVENGSLVIENAWILWNSKTKFFNCCTAFETKHCVKEFDESHLLAFASHQDFENAIAKGVDVLVFLAIVGKSFGMFVDIFDELNKLDTVHELSVPVKFRGSNLQRKFPKKQNLVNFAINRLQNHEDCKQLVTEYRAVG